MSKLKLNLIKALTGIDVEQLQNDNENLLIKNQQLATDIRDANKDVSYNKTHLSETQEELAKAQSEITRLQTSVSGLQQEISRLQNEISTLQSDKEESLAKLQHSTEETASLETTVNRLTGQLQETEQKISGLTTDKSGLEKQIQDLQRQLEENRQKIQNLLQEKQQLAEETASLKQNCETLEKERTDLIHKIEESDSKLQELSDSYAAQQKDNQQSQTELQQQKQANEQLQANLDNLKGQIKDLQTSYDNLEAEKQKQAENSKQLEENYRQLQEDNRQLQETLSAQQASIEEISADKENALKELQNLQRKHTEWENEKAGLMEQNAMLQKQISEMQQQATENQEPSPNVQKPEPSTVPQEAQKEKEPETTGNILEDYQKMKAKLEESTLHHPYTRITTEPDGSQFIFESKTLQLKAELFIWGVEGKEVVLDDVHFIPYNEIADIEGLETPFSTETLDCNFSDEGNGTEVAETLLMSICSYRPIQISYHDKNGRIYNRNLYWVSFLPENGNKIRLPYEGLFHDMFNDNIDADHIIAMCSHYPDPKIFIINQIQSIRIFDAFVTDQRGINALIDGLYSALLASQPEAAELIYQCLPEKFRKLPAVVANRAHYKVITGDYEEAMELYMSIDPKTHVSESMTWEMANAADFDDLIRHNIAAEAFIQLKEALGEQGWNLE